MISSTPVTADTPKRWHRYQRSTMAVLLVIGIVSLALLGSDATVSYGVLLNWGELILVLAIDGKGVPRLRGRIGWHPILVALLFIFFWWFLWLYFYLVVAAVDTWKRRQPRPTRAFDHEREIAKLEGELGILPLAEGTCANCHRPLQAGAEFCAYCGTPVALPLQVCSACGARTFPDAEWCPKCGAALQAHGAEQARVERGS